MKNNIGYILTENFKYEMLTLQIKGEYTDNLKGFQYYESISDTLKYLMYHGCNKNSVILKIEIIGDIENDGYTLTTNHIKVLEAVDPSTIPNWPILKYHNNNLIYSKDLNGLEKWYDYDSHNNLIHYENSKDYEEWFEFDKNKNLIHYKNSNDHEYWQDFDSNNNVTHYKTLNNYEYWREYDSHNNLIYYKDSNGIEWKK